MITRLYELQIMDTINIHYFILTDSRLANENRPEAKFVPNIYGHVIL